VAQIWDDPVMGMRILLLAASVLLAAPVGSVRGVVHDQQHRPIPGATVTLTAQHADWTQTTVTDANGEFQFLAVPVGDYTVVVTLEGFERATQTVSVASGTTPILHVPLSVAGLSQAVTVTASPDVAGQAGAVTPTTTIDRDEIRLTPGADRTNGLEAITAFVPGAYVTHDQLHLRGGHQASWLVDGVPVPNTNIAGNVGPQLDPKDMDYLEVMRGSYDADYGDRTYGVFNIVPRTGFERDNEAELLVSFGSFRQTNDQFNFGGHTQRFAYYASASGNRSNLGLETPAAEVRHDRQWGASGFGTLIFNATPANQVRLVSSVRHDDYQIPNDPAADASLDDSERESDAFLNLSWVRTFRSGALLTISPFVHLNGANYDGGAADFPVSTTVHRSSRYAGGQATIAHSSLRNEFHAGIYGFAEQDRQLFAVTFADHNGGGFTARETPSGGQIAVFAENKLHAASWLTLTAGVRQTHFRGGVTEDATSPRLGLTLRLPRIEWMVRGFYGRFYQAPPLATASGPLLEFVTANDFGFIPLHGERDRESQIGITIPVHGWILDADRVRTRATSFLDHNPVGTSNVFFPLTIDGAAIDGTELTVRSPRVWRRGEIHLAYSHQHADGLGGISGGLTDFGDETGRFPLDHDQRNTLSAGFAVTLAKGFFAAANAYYGSGFPDAGGPAYLPGHTTFDLMAGRSFGDRLSAAINVLNAGNRHLLVDNSVTFGGTHFNKPREVYAEVRYRFHY
jgi:carboxypeptidase family protein/TonB-dependent receptor-like protein